MQATIESLRELNLLQVAVDDRRRELWWNDPVRWVADCMPSVVLADYQTNELQMLADHKRVAVRGPRGSGKTMPAAIAHWWFVCTREAAKVDWKVPTTASVYRQLSKFLWPEIHRWAKHIDWKQTGVDQPNTYDQLLSMRVNLEYGESFAINSNDPDLIEGAHADNLFAIIDEAKAVPDASFDSIEGYFANPGEHYAFALSIPGAPAGRFYDICVQAPGYDDWHPIKVTWAEAVAAGRVVPEWGERRKKQWGEDSVLYRCHVLAEFAGTEDGVIPMAWVEAAMYRYEDLVDAGTQFYPRVLGVDVADTGGDRHAIAIRDNTTIYSLETIPYGDTLDLAALVENRARRGSRIVIDSIGVGAGTTHALQRNKDLKVQPFVAGAGTKRRDKTGEVGFPNKRSAAWWNLRELLDPDNPDPVAIVPHPELLGDLTTPAWREVAGGKIQVEAKADIRKRLGRSTDIGDTVVQAFWEESAQAVVDLSGWVDTLGQTSPNRM